MDYWLNVLILFIVGGLCFYIGHRVGFVKGEVSWWEEEDDEQ